jgi:hypothetical protein
MPPAYLLSNVMETKLESKFNSRSAYRFRLMPSKDILMKVCHRLVRRYPLHGWFLSSFVFLALSAPISVASAQSWDFTDQQVLERVPNPYPTPNTGIVLEQLSSALLRGDFNYAISILSEAAQNYVRNNPQQAAEGAAKIINSVATWLRPKVQAILNDGSKTDAQKSNEINAIVDSTFLPAVSQATGQLSAQYQYSLPLQVARVAFKVPHRFDVCWYQVGFGSVPTITAAYQRSPEVSIYRITGVSQTLVTSVASRNEYNVSNQPGFGFNLGGLYKAVRSAWNTSRTTSLSVNAEAIPFDLPSGMFLRQGRTLGYRIVARFPSIPFSPGSFSCTNQDAAKEFSYESTVLIDSNGDAKIDIATDADYSRYNGLLASQWLPAVLSIMKD